MTKSIEDNLISQLGLDDLPQEKKIELIMKWGNLVQKDIIMRILRELPEKDKKELDELLAEKGENMEDIYKFLENKMPNLDDLVREEIEKFREEIKADAKQLGII
ncbi:MAG: hypothetical protein A3A94_01255 [Candidatus Portnoybacteria bacterium RIFCSPLOWO2_01_FULL_43_11]|uniref:Uncharacterized protein n=3 Tax=Candidatus Portnoyibacteriota TaxID=1817913 RepID=A0A1G2FE35_9BACT|nr:MAG: hypothetical protein A2815_00215 [Candidatus Portnoybacteria bacterium RIFCSPHIGHO2_01_FULL_40_12b]OGZ38265.1 MAG: hypothetical protein A3E90_02970 [Candidatus Portnoybacteria bacterium RIFCSPHIGHO2_12_FULL_40_11]OGZ38944.1 MAG: hypothetical protein A3A94_01255 [Candidatus Portnoybacteria bacterium RIFCSPLOWO2_01_FULL_43_11]